MRAGSASSEMTRVMRPSIGRALPAVAIAATLAAWYLTPWPAVALLWAAVFVGLAWRWPRVAPALLPLTFPFWYAPVHVTGQLVFPLSELALAVVTVVAVGQLGVRMARAPSWQLRRMGRAYLARVGGLVAPGAALLLVGMTIGVIIARAPQPALRAWRWEIAEPLIYGALVVWRLRGRWLWRSLWAFVASGVMVAALALAQATFAHVTFAPLGAGGGLIPYAAWNGLSWRATAIIYGSPNSAGAWMARALPLALAVALWPRAAGRVERLIAALAVAALLAGLALTGSRGAWLGAIAGAAAVGALLAAVSIRPSFPAIRLPATPAWLLAITLAAALVYGASSIWLAPLVGLSGGAHGGSGEVRLLVWQAAQAMGRDHPVFGVGPDQFLYYYDPRYTSHPYLIARLNGRLTAAAREPNLSHPHNLGLELWLSAGLAGLVGYILALVAAAWRGLRAVKRGWHGALAAGVLGALAVGLAHGLVDSAYFQPDFALAFWWGVAALIALSHAPSHTRSAAS